MNAIKLFGILLLAAGLVGLVYGGFTYTKPTQAAKIGPVELVVNEQHNVAIPLWAGVGAVVAGGALLLVASKK